MEPELPDLPEHIVTCPRCGFERGRFRALVGICVLPPPGRDIPKQCQRCGYIDRQLATQIAAAGLILLVLLIPAAIVVLWLYARFRRAF